MKFSPKDLYRFWSKVDIKSEDECWNWKNSKDNEYGRFELNTVSQLSHRIAYYLTYGEIPKDLMICHKCNNRKCCNPNHLYAGTSKDNIRDSINAGTLYALNIKGEKHPRAKLSYNQVLEIRDLLNSGIKQSKIAEKFSIKQSCVSKIKNNLRWKE